jgi:SAM-dependent methyltransferase
VYDRYWAAEFATRALPALDRLLLGSLPAAARLLDVCCGTGRVAHALTGRGFAVTGVDASGEMLRLARQNAPEAELRAADARTLGLPAVYDGALCVFDSLNHVTATEELVAVFRNVHAALLEGGAFVFDLNMDEGYRARWRGSSGIVADDHVCVVRARYRPEDGIGETHVTIFRLEGEWRRDDVRLVQRCYSEEQVRAALAAAGFRDVTAHDAQREHAMPGDVGRTFFRGFKREVKVGRDA